MRLRKQTSTKSILDPYAFKNLKEEMKIKSEHTKMLGDFLVAQGYKISQGKSDKTFEEVFETLKQTIIQVKKLQDSYEK